MIHNGEYDYIKDHGKHDDDEEDADHTEDGNYQGAKSNCAQVIVLIVIIMMSLMSRMMERW